LLGQVGDVQTAARQDVALIERIGISTDARVEPLVDVNIDVTSHILQT
jgi:hypothetical protein